MAQVFAPRSHRLTAISLAGLYSSASLLSWTMLIWLLSGQVSSSPANAQAPSPISPLPTQPVRNAPTLNSQQPLPTLTPGVPVDPLPSVQPSFGLDSEFNLEGAPVPVDKWARYRLGAGDGIFVNVQRFPDLSFQGLINPEGSVVLPLIGTVALEGLTLEEAQARIQQALDQYIVNPIVSVSLIAQRPVQVTVIGEVAKPGFYPLPVPRVSAALLSAGGTTMTADLRSVRVRRSLSDGSVLEQSMDLFSPLKNGGTLPDLRLEDGDAIVVSKLAGGIDQDYDRALVARSTLAKQEINVRVLSYSGGAIGNLRLPNGSNFLDALTAIAPNPDSANLRQVALVRFNPEQGRAVTQTLDGKSALMGDTSQHVPLQDNDVIVIGRNLVSRITYALNTFTQPFRDVLGFLLFFREINDNATNLFGPTRR